MVDLRRRQPTNITPRGIRVTYVANLERSHKPQQNSGAHLLQQRSKVTSPSQSSNWRENKRKRRPELNPPQEVLRGDQNLFAVIATVTGGL